MKSTALSQLTFSYPLIAQQDYHGPEPKQYTYEGGTGTYRGRKYRLGPRVRFTARERTVEEWTDLLRRMYAYGGYFAAGKAYAQVLIEFQEDERNSENRRDSIDAELLPSRSANDTKDDARSARRL